MFVKWHSLTSEVLSQWMVLPELNRVVQGLLRSGEQCKQVGEKQAAITTVPLNLQTGAAFACVLRPWPQGIPYPSCQAMKSECASRKI